MLPRLSKNVHFKNLVSKISKHDLVYEIMNVNMKKIILSVFSLMFVVTACKTASGTEPSVDNEEFTTEAVETLVAQAGDGEETYPDDRYPALAFLLLSPTEKVTFVELAQAEFCPCSGQVVSLDTCLQSLETTCHLASNIGSLMMRMIKEDADNSEISDAIQQQVQAARQVYEFDLSESPRMGPADAEVTIVVFSDFQCPHCRNLASVIEELTTSYDGQVNLYAKQFPLNSHPAAFSLAVAALAAHKQDHYWEFSARIFRDGLALNVEDPLLVLAEWANELNMNSERFFADLMSEELSAQVTADRQEALDSEINSTPTVFINGVRYVERQDEPSLRAFIDALLEQ